MGQIQSSIGLVTGIPILDTVDKLMAISARPRDLVAARNNKLQAEQIAIAKLTSLVLGVKFASDRLGDATVFDKKTATSSDANLLSVAITGSPPIGTFSFTPLQKAQAHQVISSGLGQLTDPLQNGTLKIRFGGEVDRGVELDLLGGGNGVQRGRIRITDRSGLSAEIDLRYARTVDDVLDAINANSVINVTALTDGDRLKLVDQTGQSASNLRVQEVDGGTTAADLGLASINVAANEAAGLDIVRLFNDLALARLNDNNGVGFRDQLSDFTVTFADGSSQSIDVAAVSTVGDLLTALNAADPARLSAAISAGGDRIELTDLTSGAGTFSVSSPVGGTAAEDLGLTGPAVGGVIGSRRLLAGAGTSLLTSFKGGQGLGTLGAVNLTDRSGATTSVDLSAAETLDAVINQINAQAKTAGVGITASVNAARNGILLADTTGGANNLIVANADATNTADLLGIAINAAQSTVDGGSLDLQVVGPQTQLASLNGGRGVTAGSFKVVDSKGTASIIILNQPGAEVTTVGGILDAINAGPADVTARINDTGDGILIVDQAAGSATLAVDELSGGTTAKDLHLLASVQNVDYGGTIKQTVDGATTLAIDIDAITEDPNTPADEQTTLNDLISYINGLQAGLTANAFFDGQTNRLLVTSDDTGAASRFQVDTTGAPFTVEKTAEAQDAVLVFGAVGGVNAGVFVTAKNNTFDSVLSGTTLTVQDASTSAVGIDISATDSEVVAAAQSFVDAYNALKDELDAMTAFNEVDNTTAVLFGSLEALRVETELANLVSGRFSGAGGSESLEAVGIELDDKGSLSLDKTKLQAAYAADPDGLEKFFTDSTFGVSAQFSSLIDRIAGSGSSLLVGRADALTAKIDSNDDRIAFFDKRLAVERERLLSQFYRMETAIAQLRSNLDALLAFSPLPPLV